MHRSCWLGLAIMLCGPLGDMARASEAEVRQAVEAYVGAINKKDANAIAAAWGPNAVHSDRATGVRIEGRDAIVADITAALKSEANARLGGHLDRIRFIQPNVAQVDGRTKFVTAESDPVLSSFSAILVKTDGHWLIDSIEEGDLPTPSSPSDALRDLDWMVGHWVDESQDIRVETTVRWTANRSFLLRSFQVQDAQGTAQQGTQVIGWDPRSKEIRSWTFNSDGSFGDGTWSKHGEDWLVKSSQTLADGQAASGTYVFSKIDDNTLTVQLIGHEIEGEPKPSSDVVKVVRVTETPSAAAQPNK